MNGVADTVPARESWWRRHLLAPLVAQLRQGTTPRKLALTLAAGAVLGLFPVLGSTTLLCALAAARFRLNQPLIQTVNYLLYPAQLALLLPLLRAGEWLFRQPPVPLLSLTQLSARFWQAPAQFLVDYGLVAAYGVVAWALMAVPLFALLYFATDAPIRRLARRLRRVPGPQP